MILRTDISSSRTKTEGLDFQCIIWEENRVHTTTNPYFLPIYSAANAQSFPTKWQGIIKSVRKLLLKQISNRQ